MPIFITPSSLLTITSPFHHPPNTHTKSSGIPDWHHFQNRLWPWLRSTPKIPLKEIECIGARFKKRIARRGD
jgi:hypothetical protein